MPLPYEPLPVIGFESRSAMEAGSEHEAAIPEDTGEIIAFILGRYHAGHQRELPGLIDLARKVESIHANHPEAPLGLADCLLEMSNALDTQMQKEEQVLFPMMEGGGHPMIGHPIAVMRFEHDEHSSHLAKIAGLTNDLRRPEEACGSWRALYLGLTKPSNDLIEHMRIENDVLFPRFG